MRPFPYDREVYSGRKGGSRARLSVYVPEDADLDRARAIVGRYIRGEPLSDPKKIRSWRCPSCNELIEGQFLACWKCGRPKE